MTLISFGADERTGLPDALADELRRREYDLALYGPPGGRNE